MDELNSDFCDLFKMQIEHFYVLGTEKYGYNVELLDSKLIHICSTYLTMLIKNDYYIFFIAIHIKHKYNK